MPAAAQLACTPLVAAISGQVSLVAVAANLAVAPVVGPATVLGLLGGLVGLVSGVRLAAWSARRGLVRGLDRRGRRARRRAAGRGDRLAHHGRVAGSPRRGHRGRGVGRSAGARGIGLPVPRPACCSWPSPWRGRPLPAGRRAGGCSRPATSARATRSCSAPDPAPAWWSTPDPTPALVDACLRRLGVTQVPLVVLTHFHADHVDGLAGVLDHRTVGEIDVTRLADPPGGVALVDEEARSAGLGTDVAAYGVTRRVGDVTLQTLWPLPSSPTVGPGDGSTANEASVVLLAEVRGVRLLLDRRHRAGRPGCAGPDPARPAGRRAQGAAPRQPLPGPRVPRLARRAGRRGVRRRRQRLRPSGAEHPRQPGRDGRSRCCAPTSTATSSSPSVTDGWSPSPDERAGMVPRARDASVGCGRLASMSGRATRGPQPDEVLGRVTLVTGKEEFLNERTVAAVREAVRRHDAEAELSECRRLRADAGRAGRDVGAVALLLDPLRRGPRAGEPARRVRRRPARLRRRARRGGRAGARARRRAQGQRSADQAAQAGRRHRGRSPPSSGRRTTPGSSPARSAATAPPSTTTRPTFLVQAVGQDLRSLAAAADQLANDFPGESLTVEKVKRYFGGRAEAKSFAVADAAFWGRRRGALEELRWAIDGGTAPVLVTSAFAGGARGRGALQVRARGDARGRPGPRGGRAAVEAAHDPRPVPRLVRRRRSPGRSGRSPRPTPTSRARPATRRTRSSGWCSPSPPCVTPSPRPRNDDDPSRRLHTALSQAATDLGRVGGRGGQSEAAFLAIADLRLAAWFLWMTPLDAALSSLRRRRGRA